MARVEIDSEEIAHLVSERKTTSHSKRLADNDIRVSINCKIAKKI